MWCWEQGSCWPRGWDLHRGITEGSERQDPGKPWRKKTQVPFIITSFSPLWEGKPPTRVQNMENGEKGSELFKITVCNCPQAKASGSRAHLGVAWVEGVAANPTLFPTCTHLCACIHIPYPCEKLKHRCLISTIYTTIIFSWMIR